MNETHELLPLIWMLVISFGVIMYVVLDGFDLGIGILFPWARSHDHRDLMMNSVAPVWDGNETWLILGGAGLFAAFPLAYSVLLPALYIPIMLMLTALIFRGVSFEFRFKAHQSRFLWDISFSVGSFCAAFCQGMILGAVVQGIEVANHAYAGGAFDWLTPFSLLCGLSVVIGYALLGATWLVMKTEAELQHWSTRAARWLLPTLLLSIAGVSIWTPMTQPAIAERWFSLPNFYWLSQVPFITFLLAAACWYSLRRRKYDALPFWFSIGLFVLSYIGLVISLWPYIVPRAITLWEAAAPPATQLFVLVGVLILLPLILTYTIIGYKVFAGKVKPGEGYH